MSASLALQYAVIALAVLASAWFVMRAQFPQAMRALRVRIAVWLLREGRPAVSHAIGRRIAPVATATAPGCTGCSNCE